MNRRIYRFSTATAPHLRLPVSPSDEVRQSSPRILLTILSARMKDAFGLFLFKKLRGWSRIPPQL
ncbi:hypothetical protein ANCCAN_29486 [Ancylostoma caninum]|uniref:Uncharacterized protein n=1 Tax=Ancylostoma caninum TaxID=29170 RepID=A0A368EYC8_ANCCA|nr:hypothetical protein ANCCAN_29486 [Ancylostoma caninum]